MSEEKHTLSAELQKGICSEHSLHHTEVAHDASAPSIPSKGRIRIPIDFLIVNYVGKVLEELKDHKPLHHAEVEHDASAPSLPSKSIFH